MWNLTGSWESRTKGLEVFEGILAEVKISAGTFKLGLVSERSSHAESSQRSVSSMTSSQ